MPRRLSKEIKEKIIELKKLYTNKEVYSILWWKASLSTIEKTKVNNRNVKNVCKKCWKTFYYVRYKKYCIECSWYNAKKKLTKQRKRDLELKKEREEFLKETIRITWLSFKKVKELNLHYTQTEIREMFKKS